MSKEKNLFWTLSSIKHAAAIAIFFLLPFHPLSPFLSLLYSPIRNTSSFKGPSYQENSLADSSVESRKRYRGCLNIFGVLRIRRPRLPLLLRQVVKGLDIHRTRWWKAGRTGGKGRRQLEYRRGASVYGRRDAERRIERVGRRVLH